MKILFCNNATCTHNSNHEQFQHTAADSKQTPMAPEGMATLPWGWAHPEPAHTKPHGEQPELLRAQPSPARTLPASGTRSALHYLMSCSGLTTVVSF